MILMIEDDEERKKESNVEGGSYEPVACRKISIFTLYAKIFRFMLAKWIPKLESLREEERNKELDQLILPSNEEWRHRVYYTLVELQRENDLEISNEHQMKATSKKRITTKELQEWEWLSKGKRKEEQEEGFSTKKEKRNKFESLKGVLDAAGSMTEACIEPGWRVNDILLAAKVLQKIHPPAVYANEAEMRRVFGLVYDVLRCQSRFQISLNATFGSISPAFFQLTSCTSDKNILNSALEDVGFWYHNRSFKKRERIVWLLLYDLQGRKFGRRGEIATLKEREMMFEEAGIKDIEDALLFAKTRLAASVSRLRIGGAARNFDELLPTHLRIAEGVAWNKEDAVASGWVNTCKIRDKDEFLKEMTKLGFEFRRDYLETTELQTNHFIFDRMCPKVINLCEKSRERLAVSALVREHRFVFFERSLCLGAAALAQAIRVARLCGPIVLTHSIAPRHTGYLAGLLTELEGVGRLLAFGAGERRYEYESYLRNLGITLQQCRVFSEKYASPPPSTELERATVVLVTPPSSYTGVKDIVDLAVARGGDTDLLEMLTTDSGSDIARRPHALLNDQFSTLKYALTRPNVQLLIYEAHTVLPSETTEMIRRVVEYANRMAIEKYLREHPPRRKVSDEKKEKTPKRGTRTQLEPAKTLKCDNVSHDDTQDNEDSNDRSKKNLEGERECGDADDDDNDVDDDNNDDDDAAVSLSPSTSNLKIPESDLFEVASIEEIYDDGKTLEETLDRGSFLALIRRKEMMQFDSLFMIKVAESKGLFGEVKRQEAKPNPVEVPVDREFSRRNRRRFKVAEKI